MNSTRYRQLLISILLLCSVGSANAYFDPNTGGIIYQILFPLLVAIGAGWSFLKQAFINLFGRFIGRSPKPPSHRPGAHAPEKDHQQ